MAFSRIGRIIGKFRELLDFPRRMHEEVRRLERATHADTRNIQIALKQQTKRIEDVRSRHAKQQAELEHEIQSVHAELRDRLLQYHLQLGRLTSLIEGRAAGEPEAYTVSIPFSVDVPPPRAESSIDRRLARAGALPRLRNGRSHPCLQVEQVHPARHRPSR